MIDLEKRFPGGPVIRADLRIELESAPIVVLFGPSGSGKTTLLRCLAGLERPERGRIRFGQETWIDTGIGRFVPPQQRRLGFLFQDYALFPHLSVAKNIGYGLRGQPPEVARERVAGLMRLLQLEGLEDRRPAHLSGGQRQRVALARSLALEPRLLLLDEPLSALDGPTREHLRGELRQMLRRLRIPALVVTHDRVEALALGDTMVVLGGGQVLQSGPVEAVFSNPGSLEVARTVGMETVVPARVVARSEGLVTVEVGGARLLAVDPGDLEGGEAFACIRAEDVTLERSPASRTSARNHLEARIVSLHPEGPLVRVRLSCGFPLVALVTRQSCVELELREGAEVTVAVKAPAIRLVAHSLER